MKKFMYLSLILNVLVIAMAVFAAYYFDVEAATQKLFDRNSLSYYERQSQNYKTLPDSEGEVIFLGNRFIEEANWSELLENPKVKNRGIAGDNAEGILKRLDEVLSSKPAKIFMLLGLDELRSGKNADDIIKAYQKIIDKIQKDSPKTQIYIHSLSPIRYDQIKIPVKNEDIIVLNGQLEKFAKENKVTFIDIFSAFVGDQKTQELKPEYTNNGIHLNAQAYIRWKALLGRYLNE